MPQSRQFQHMNVNNPIKGTGTVQMDLCDTTHDNPIADAFAIRYWLVELVFAQCRYVVAIGNLYVDDAGRTYEVNTAGGALRIARANAKRAYRHLGNLMSSDVISDTENERRRLGVSGPQQPRVEHSRKWHDLWKVLPAA